jgi:DNA-binding NtrC family response regulator
MMNTTVLLVHDEVPFVDAMTRRLGKRNLDILAAYSGPQALNIINADKKSDVAILDVKMPGMGGEDQSGAHSGNSAQARRLTCLSSERLSSREAESQPDQRPGSRADCGSA